MLALKMLETFKKNYFTENGTGGNSHDYVACVLMWNNDIADRVEYYYASSVRTCSVSHMPHFWLPVF